MTILCLFNLFPNLRKAPHIFILIKFNKTVSIEANVIWRKTFLSYNATKHILKSTRSLLIINVIKILIVLFKYLCNLCSENELGYIIV